MDALENLGKRNLALEGWDATGMLFYIRDTLQARLEGRNEGGDTEVMRLVDEIVDREGAERWYDSSSHGLD